jgi:Putative Ig domain
VTITGTPSAQGTFSFTVKVTDSHGASGTQALSITIGAPLPLKVATTSLPNGVLDAPYPSTVLQASGGVPPFTWAITLGALPTGLALASDGTISGKPTATGTFNFTVQVTDSETPAQTATGSLSITVNNLGPLKGNYAFLFRGFNSSGAVAIAGSFTADGLGNITNGVEDFNSAVSNSYQNLAFTGTYTLGSDNRGVLTFSSLQGSPAFAFAVDAAGAHGRMIEFDSSGIRGSGQLQKRAVSICTSATLAGQYAFGVSGQVIASVSSSAGPAVIVGSFLATPPVGSGTGSISNAENDANTPSGIITQSQGWDGSFQTTSQNTRCSMNLLSSIAPGGLTYSVYPVSATEGFMVETDQVTSTQPFLTSGRLLLQTGYPFTGGAGSAFTGVSVGGLTGELLSGSAYVPDLALVELTGSSSASFSMSLTENVAGTVTANLLSGSFSSFDLFGRLDSGITTPVHPVFYMVDNNEAFCLGEILNDPFFGIFEPQSAGPFTASSLNGDFVLGTSSPATLTVPDLSGSVTLTNTSATAGTISGTQDQSTSSANTAAQTVTGTYAGLNSSTGAGTAGLTAPTTFSGDFVVVAPTKIVILSTTASDANPVLIYLGACTTDTCGED